MLEEPQRGERGQQQAGVHHQARRGARNTLRAAATGLRL